MMLQFRLSRSTAASPLPESSRDFQQTTRLFNVPVSDAAETLPQHGRSDPSIYKRDTTERERCDARNAPNSPSSLVWAWERLRIDSEKTRMLAQRLCRDDERASLDHEITWLLDGGAGEETTLIVYGYGDGHDVIGYVPVRRRKTSVTLYFGPIALVSAPIERYSIIGAPLFAPEARSREVELTHALLTKITADLPPQGVLLAYGARTDSALFTLLSQRTVKLPGFHLVRHGEIHQRRLIRRQDTFDAYVAGLGPKTRENIRRHHRRLSKAPGGEIILKRYSTVSEVRPFLDAAVSISRLTYQWNLYGSGLRDPKLESHLEFAADSGWMCCYLLFKKNRPIAFMMGCRYGITYYSQEIGYDPKWRQYSVGNVLHLLAVKDLFESDVTTHIFDFLFGDAPHKRLLSNFSRNEGNFYLFPSTFAGLIRSTLIRLDNLASSFNANLEKYQLKVKLRQFLRTRVSLRAG
jgi:hypothetical protein